MPEPRVRTVYVIKFKEGKRWVDSGYGEITDQAEAVRLARESGREWRIDRVKPQRNRGINDMARRLRVIRNPEGLEYGQWIPIHAVKFNDDGSVSMMAEHRAANRGRRRRRNIAAGYWAGEPPLKRRKKAKAKRRRR